MSASPKFYVVWKGRKQGIFRTWADCKAQIEGFQGAVYKSFPSLSEAQAAYTQNALQSENKPILDSLSVDAACSGNPGLMEYQGVHTRTKERIFHLGPFTYGTNNIGEFLALVHGLAYLKKEGREDVCIYTDSMTAMAWVRNKKAKTQLEQRPENAKLFELIERAEAWLAKNTYKNKILKWDTPAWGEIPADFGRKG